LVLAASIPLPGESAAGKTAAALAPAAAESVGMSAERLRRMREVVRGLVDRNELAGVVLLVARDGRLVELSALGYQDRERKVPMKVDSLFRIASQTKAITTVAVLLLYEEGRLVLTDPVSNYLPEWKAPKVLIPGK